MAINKDEIEKYIFDPENPKGCKTYQLLINIAKKKPYTLFSPYFLQYFFAQQIITKEFDEEIWDKPDDYDSFTAIEKLKLFTKINSKNDLFDFVQNIDFKTDKILKFSFLNSLNNFYKDISFDDALWGEPSDTNLSYLKEYILSVDTDYTLDSFSNKIEINKNNIFFSKNNFEILNFHIIKSSIFITLEENIDKFIELNKNPNIKPLFLKKIEDVDLLLNVLENDLKQTAIKNKPKEEIQTLNTIKIKDVFSIKEEIELMDLKDKKEIYIVGENGDGKTLLLQAIALGLKGTAEDGLKAFRDIEETYSIEIENKELCQNNFLAYGAMRNSVCQMKEDKTGFLTLFSGEYDLKSPIDWLLALDYSEKSEKKNVISVKEAKKLLQTLLNSDIEIEILPPNQVTFTEKGSIVEFQQLSAGYKGVITIVCDLINRLSQKQEVEEIADFQGIVLIDEVELHLHPKWSYGFMKKLRDTFPLIQFIVTTHSPSVILGADEKAVFYKIYKEEGEVRISQPMDNIKNLMANVLVTSPLFDMDTARARNSDKDIDTSDDFIYTKIHENIAKRVEGKKYISENDIVAMVDEELDKFLEENDL